MNTQNRIVCPKCRSNNFPGKTHCWQCNAPLPPPEAVTSQGFAPGAPTNTGARTQTWVPQAPPPRQTVPQPAQNWNAPPVTNQPEDNFGSPSQPRSRSIWLFALIPVVLVVLVGAVVFVKRGTQKAAGPDDSLKAQIEMAKQQEKALGRGTGSSTDSSDDPMVNQAKRDIDRLRKENGIDGPPADNQGNVHLQVGGKVSEQQYDRALEALKKAKFK